MNHLLKEYSLIFYFSFLLGVNSFSQVEFIDLDIPIIKGFNPINKKNYLIIGDTSKQGLIINLTKKNYIETVQLFQFGQLHGFSFQFKKGFLSRSTKFKNGSLEKIDSADYNMSLSDFLFVEESKIDSVDYAINIQNQANSTLFIVNSEKFAKKIIVVFKEGKLFLFNRVDLNTNGIQIILFKRRNKNIEINPFDW